MSTTKLGAGIILPTRSSTSEDIIANYNFPLFTYFKMHPSIVIFIIFIASIFGLWCLYLSLPDFDPSEKAYLTLPTNIDDAKIVGEILSRYKEKHFYSVLSSIFIIYIFLQTFAIPGSIFLSILSGFLFPFYLALCLVCFSSATGASFCYLLSKSIGKRAVEAYFPDKIKSWAETVEKHKDNITFYIIFLRITPFLPNWFINIAAPLIDVPLLPFFIGTFIGVAPPSFVAIQTGTTLQKLTSSNEAFNWNNILILLGLGLFSLLPILFKKYLKDKFD